MTNEYPSRRWPLRWAAGLILAGLASLLPTPHSLLPAGAPLPAANAEARLRRDVTFLASDECEGRGPGTRGIDRAADYLATQFRQAGLKPGNGKSYFQPFTIPGSVLDRPATLVL